MSKTEPIRHRYMADRLLAILLYKPADPAAGIERLPDGFVLLKMGPLARLLKLNSSKLYDQLLFLHSMGYIDTFDIKYAWGRVRVRPTLPLCHWNVDSEKK
jgi:hypothetical protein